METALSALSMAAMASQGRTFVVRDEQGYPIERRATPRVRLGTSATLLDIEFRDGTDRSWLDEDWVIVRDIGEGGVQLWAARALPELSDLRLHLNLPQDGVAMLPPLSVLSVVDQKTHFVVRARFERASRFARAVVTRALS